MTQVVTRIDDQLVADLDSLVAAGDFASRSEGVRVALEKLVDEHRRRRIGEEIVEGYRRQPQTEEELAWTDEATQAMIEAEPW